MNLTSADALLEGLNPDQRAAVAAGLHSHLILAGAGSGKTRVLTRRIAWLHRHFHIPLHGILAVTFTNKAANEMRERIEPLVGHARGLWVGTFHSIGHRLLRLHPHEAGLVSTFQVLDADDQVRLVKRVGRDLAIDEDTYAPRDVAGWINGHKDEGREVGDIVVRTPFDATMAAVWRAYQERCERAGLVDFSDLLLKTRNLLRDSESVRTHYQGRFRHILVDEFQDTNAIQYEIVQLLAGEQGSVFAVGDVDQCVPAGTSVRMADGSEQPVETVRAGMHVATLDNTGARAVEAAHERWFEGELVVVETEDGHTLAATPSHTHLIVRPEERLTAASATVDLVLGDAPAPFQGSHRLTLAARTPRGERLLEGLLPDGEMCASWAVEDLDSVFGALALLDKNAVRVRLAARLAGAEDQPLAQFVAARDVRPGDGLIGEDGRMRSVVRTRTRPYAGPVYDLDVSHAHHFLANGLATHNCIYGWRGARVDNLPRFLKEFPNASLLRLEQNYRSTQTILDAANALIQNNPNRIEKNLWTESEKGEKIVLYTALNEIDEAQYVVGRIAASIRNGNSPSDHAILYRSNAQSRVFEEALIARSLPYRITGGLRFFERAEIKDALSYMRLTTSRADDAAFERVINTPTRGLGDKSLDVIRARAHQDRVSLWDGALALLAEGSMAARAAGALRAFMGLIENFSRHERTLPFAEAVAGIIEGSGLKAHTTRAGKNGTDPEREARGENLDELVSVASRFVMPPEDKDAGLDPWLSFLTHAALEAGEKQSQQGPCVELMTLHAAKGLEFPHVFLVGLEEGLFPSGRASTDGRLDEERRLAYVGITRAERHLTLCHATERRIYGQWTSQPRSRFVDELPKELLAPTRAGAPAPRLMRTPAAPTGGLRSGTMVEHPQWGRGVVAQAASATSGGRVRVAFKNKGLVWLDAQDTSLRAV